MFRTDFAAFILSHGRPDKVSVTIDTLRRTGYTGRWYIVLDDGDKTAPQYAARWGAERILTFHKDDAHTDMADNGGNQGVIIYARNACEQFALDLGLTYYIQLDDDYTRFHHRWAGPDGTFHGTETRRLDDVLNAFIDFLDDTGALTVAFGQGGDYIGGSDNAFVRDGLRRKAMNSFITRVGRPINFVGRINEDVNTYTWRGSQGDLFLTVAAFGLNQAQTQQTSGGMTDIYLAAGTYLKSFYTVLFHPSAVKISTMGRNNHRIHHHVQWDHAVPKIVSSRHSKGTPVAPAGGER